MAGQQSVITPIAQRMLWLLFVLFALLSVNALYLGAVTLAEWLSDDSYQDYFYLINFLFHLAAGLLLLLPFCLFIVIHIARARPHPNQKAKKAGIRLLLAALVILLSGLVLTRFQFFEVKEPLLRQLAYWLHLITPPLSLYLFVSHRRMGHHFRWQATLPWLSVATGFATVMILLQVMLHPAATVVDTTTQPYAPSLARTASGQPIRASHLMMDNYCQECHADLHEGWSHSVHRFSSFNNPAYLAAAKETREFLLKRDGNDRGFAFCAACHDPVPLFSGAMAAGDFDMDSNPLGKAGLTCSACHAIESIGSSRGNGDYVLAEPRHYPFTDSDNPQLKWLNRQLIKAKPDFHNRTFLKPLHKSAEFCSTCHKVALPEAVNGYKWLRGQDHYDSFLLSGVSGHGVSSFYYPPRAVERCASCHMPTSPSGDFGARHFGTSELTIHDHQFAAANTAVPHLAGMPVETIEARRKFLQGALRVDLFGIRGEEIDSPLIAPLRPQLPALQPGGRYQLEVVVRTLRVGHTFTQGTADSNQVWLEVEASNNKQPIGHSGAMREQSGEVDPWSHFINAYVLDRQGGRISRRNGQDIYTVLYNHQIPPGAADVVHYAFSVPADATGEITLKVALHYRKFDTAYMRFVKNDPQAANELPIVTIASDTITLPVATDSHVSEAEPPAIPAWQRWNDYGIGLLRKGQGHQLLQAEQAFKQVEAMGRAEGAINLARAYLQEGRLDEAAEALGRASRHPGLTTPWSVTWFSALVNKQNGLLDAALEDFKKLARTDFPSARARGFDFSHDYRLLNQIGQTLIEQAKRQDKAQRSATLDEAEQWLQQVLALDSENAEAHFNLALLYAYKGDKAASAQHRALHDKYRVDDNAHDKVVAEHRRNHPAANHAAESVVIYDLQRPGAYGLDARQNTQ